MTKVYFLKPIALTKGYGRVQYYLFEGYSAITILYLLLSAFLPAEITNHKKMPISRKKTRISFLRQNSSSKLLSIKLK
jgi:hypothetical protein